MAALLGGHSASASETQLRVVVRMSDFVQTEHLGWAVNPPGSGIASPFEPIKVQFLITHDFNTVLGSASGAPTITSHYLATTPEHGQNPTYSIDYDPQYINPGFNNPNNRLSYNADYPVTAGNVTYQLSFSVRNLGGSPYVTNAAFAQWNPFGDGLGVRSLWLPDEVSVSVAVIGPAESLLMSAIAEANLTAEDAEFDATPFDDGVSNLLKYAFNMNLQAADVHTMAADGESGLPHISILPNGADGTLRYTFVRRKNSGLVYTPKKALNLTDPSSWIPLTDEEPQVTSIDGNDDWEVVIYEEAYDAATTPKLFGRVEVTLP